MNSMPQFSRAQIMLRYAVLTTFLLVFNGLWQYGQIDLGILAFIIIFNLKYMIYDVIVGYSIGRFTVYRNYWHLIGYGTAAALDLSFVFASSVPRSESEFALVGLILVTPWVLGFAYALSWLEVFVTKVIKL
jgi:hypothetical protein